MISQFASRLLTTPWDISEARGRTILSAMLQRLFAGKSAVPKKLLKARAERPEEDCYGEPLPVMEKVGDMAVIPIVGTLMLNVPDWIKSWGMGLTDINDVADEMNEAMNDPAIAFLVLDVDSPGGESVAGAKLFDLVESARKPVFTWCDDGADMCSAAFNGPLPSQMILAAKYATVGCIGSYLAVLDDVEYWKMLGFVWEVFRSGDLKGMGEDGFSEAQKKFLQELSDKWGGRFRKNVESYRTELPRELMEGQWYCGDEAARLGFTHGTAKDFDGAVKKFRGLL